MRRSIYVPNIAARFKLVVPGGSPNPAAPKLALTFSNASSNVIPGTLRESPYDPSKSVDSAMIYRSLQLKLFYFFLKLWTLRKVVSEDVVWSDVEGVGTGTGFTIKKGGCLFLFDITLRGDLINRFIGKISVLEEFGI